MLRICALDTSLLTLQTPTPPKKQVMVFKYRWLLIYRLSCIWIPSVYKTKMKIRSILPVYSHAKIIEYKNSLHTITFLIVTLEPLVIPLQKFHQQ